MYTHHERNAILWLIFVRLFVWEWQAFGLNIYLLVYGLTLNPSTWPPFHVTFCRVKINLFHWHLHKPFTLGYTSVQLALKSHTCPMLYYEYPRQTVIHFPMAVLTAVVSHGATLPSSGHRIFQLPISYIIQTTAR